MFKKRLIFLTIVVAYLYSPLSALTLKESIIEAMNTNPVVQERLKNYRATQQDLNVANSEYYPNGVKHQQRVMMIVRLLMSIQKIQIQ